MTVLKNTRQLRRDLPIVDYTRMVEVETPPDSPYVKIVTMTLPYDVRNKQFIETEPGSVKVTYIGAGKNESHTYDIDTIRTALAEWDKWVEEARAKSVETSQWWKEEIAHLKNNVVNQSPFSNAEVAKKLGVPVEMIDFQVR